MKQHFKDNKQFGLFQEFEEFRRANNISEEECSLQAFIDEIKKSLDENLKNEICIHGLRTEQMFTYVAAGLGRSKIILKEDVGTLYSKEEALLRPDFRVYTHDNKQLLIEVKNHHPKNSFAPFRLKKTYLDSLLRYANIVKMPLFIAIYWSQYQVWTLTQHDRFDDVDNKVQITFSNALKRNEMILLGDDSIGTKPPLAIRIFPDKSKQQRVS